MVDTEKRNRRQYAWQKENAERINFIMPKGTKRRIREAAERKGLSSSEYIREAIFQHLEADGIKVENNT